VDELPLEVDGEVELAGGLCGDVDEGACDMELERDVPGPGPMIV
jgi:hypothetical protein